MSVLSYLAELSGGLNIAEIEEAPIERSVSTINARLVNHFGSDVKERIRFGSSTRRTMLPRAADSASDVDLMVVFDNTYSLKPQTFISKLKRFAESCYASSEVYQSTPTVVLELGHISFDLVPAYRSTFFLYIPARSSSYQEWMYTDPFSLNSDLDKANSAVNYQLRPLTRLLKYWNARNGYVFESFDLEGRVVRIQFTGCNNLRDYLFFAVWTLYYSKYSMPEYKQQKIERAKALVDATSSYESQGMPATAEAEIKKLLPPL